MVRIYINSPQANHPTLFNQVKQWFDQHQKNNFAQMGVIYHQQTEKGYHRIEIRKVWAVKLVKWSIKVILGLNIILADDSVSQTLKPTFSLYHFYSWLNKI